MLLKTRKVFDTKSILRLSTFSFSTEENKQQQAPGLRQHNQVKAYSHDPQVNLILRQSSPNELKNFEEKEKYQSVVKKSALGLFQNYKSGKVKVKEETLAFIEYVAKNMDGKTYTMFMKHLQELKKDVLDDQNHKLNADSFLIFLDKIRSLNISNALNEVVISKLGNVDVSLLTPKALLESYSTHSIDFQFEERLRMGEIKQFAKNAVPQPRFLFDNYKVQTDLFPAENTLETEMDKQNNLAPAPEGTDLAGEDSQLEQTDVEEDGKDDYFSFFNSHERIILKPESSFKNLRSFLVHLPIDYYILLQDGYQENKAEFEKTNYIYMQNVPLLTKRKTYFKSSNAVKTIFYEDLYKCSDRLEAERLLDDIYAEDVMIDHLSQRYGEIEDAFFINYDYDKILSRVGQTTSTIKKDQAADFDQFDATAPPVENEHNEETILQFMSYAGPQKKKTAKDDTILLDQDVIVPEKRKTAIQEEIKKKEKADMGLDKPIKREGFLKFTDYADKLKMMDTALFLFGMKMHQQEGSIEFFDADFSNTIEVSSNYFNDKSLATCCQVINETLVRSGFTGKLLQIGQLKDIDDFDLSKIMVRKGLKISLRLNSFSQALEVFNQLGAATYTDANNEKARFRCSFVNPSPNYYDGKFCTHFENCIKDKFKGLDQVNEVRSDYVKYFLREMKIGHLRDPTEIDTLALFNR